MYLTRMELDIKNRNTMKLLQSRSKIHGVVESALREYKNRTRKLWRLDKLQERLYLLILSEEKPDLKDAVESYGKKTAGFETKDYTPLLNKIRRDSRWHFRLVANPTKSIFIPDKDKRGKVAACISAAQQEDWLYTRAEKNGFLLNREEFRTVGNDWHFFNKKQEGTSRVSLQETAYEGLLTVSDEEKFKMLLCNGIGRGKAYGMGLLTVMGFSGAS